MFKFFKNKSEEIDQSSAENFQKYIQGNGEVSDQNESWQQFQEGELLVDMYHTPDMVVVRSLVPGVDPEHIEISLHNDLLTVRGHRHEPEEIYDDHFFHRECFWGIFSRSVVIPIPIDEEGVKAFFKNGLVVIEIPKKKDSDPIRIEENSE